jgi:hypothetical protein
MLTHTQTQTQFVELVWSRPPLILGQINVCICVRVSVTYKTFAIECIAPAAAPLAPGGGAAFGRACASCFALRRLSISWSSLVS